MNENDVKKLMDDMAVLEKRVKALEDWKEAREKQQITYPLDQRSIKIIRKEV